MHSIIVPKDTKVQITDMGVAKVVSDLGENSEIFQSPMYRAPEIFSGGVPNKKTDLWSFSIMLLQLYTCTDEFWPTHADHPQVQYFRNLQQALGQQMTTELWEEVAKIKRKNSVMASFRPFFDEIFGVYHHQKLLIIQFQFKKQRNSQNQLENQLLHRKSEKS
ncbi:hypothetical protein CRE_14487 [Caenorhabditis remanei]|uniref:Protein kinase domain-containing protein n=1 Tax=Caenorhabditis remanei TaxID=31234 RepID=E3M966_CAERE|nr:hypothetical protein CRE_14487 [Caenorhabditis remanei]